MLTCVHFFTMELKWVFMMVHVFLPLLCVLSLLLSHAHHMTIVWLFTIKQVHKSLNNLSF